MTNILKLQKLKSKLTTNWDNGLTSTISSICPMPSGNGSRQTFEAE